MSAQLDKSTNNQEIKGYIATDIVNNFHKLENMFYKMVATLSPTNYNSVTLIKDEILNLVDKTKGLFDILSKGGLYKKVIKLNLVNQSTEETIYNYKPDLKGEFDIVIIEVSPMLSRIQSEADSLYNSLKQRTIYTRNGDIKNGLKYVKKIKTQIKSLPPVFNRILENANRMLYATEKKLESIQVEINKQKQQYYILQTIIMLSTILIIILISLYIAKQIDRTSKELEKNKEEALAANNAKSGFLANMSHEIRTPLNAILGFIDLLKEKESDKTKINYLKTIDSSSKSLLGIINDILDFSKIESGKLDIDKIDFNPREEFTITFDLFKAKASESSINLTNNISPSLPNSINSDPIRLKQVIANLLSNAVKFTPRLGNVELDIEFDASKEELLVSVKDTGIGIPEDKQDKIFEAFTQAEGSTTRKYGGTGLGLSISFKLIQMLGGELKLESKEGEGSRFYFSIPAKIGKKIEKKVIDTKETTFDDNYILVVEDNKANQMFMKVLLKKFGVEFKIANDGLEAVDMFQKEKFDLVLMDENMPNLNGIEAAKQIMQFEKERDLIHTPIVALTANALKGDRERFLDAGMDEYMTKPVDKNRLLEIFHLFLGNNSNSIPA
jgi:signal transduction histidine kinase/CheY-like chemotaxis protein